MQRIILVLVAMLVALGMVPGVAWAAPEGELPKEGINYRIVSGPEKDRTYVWVAPINIDADALAREINPTRTKYDLRMDNPKKTIAVCMVNGVPKRKAVIDTPEDRASNVIWENKDGLGHPCPPEDRRVVIVPDSDPLVFTGVKHVLPEVRERAHRDIDKCKDAPNAFECVREPLATLDIKLLKDQIVDDQDREELVQNAPPAPPSPNGPQGAGPGNGPSNGPDVSGNTAASPGTSAASASAFKALRAERDSAQAEAAAAKKRLFIERLVTGGIILILIGLMIWVVIRADKVAEKRWMGRYEHIMAASEATANAAAHLQGRITRLVLSLRMVSEKRGSLAKSLKTRSGEFTAANREIEQLKSANGAADQALTFAQTEIEAHKATISRQAGELQEMVRANGGLNDRIVTLEEHLRAANEQIELKENSYQALQENFALLGGIADLRLATIETLTSDLAEMKGLKEMFENQLNEVGQGIHAIEGIMGSSDEAPASATGTTLPLIRTVRGIQATVLAWDHEIKESRAAHEGLVGGISLFMSQLKQLIPTLKIPNELNDPHIGVDQKRWIADEALADAMTALEASHRDAGAASDQLLQELTGDVSPIPMVNMETLVESIRLGTKVASELTQGLKPYVPEGTIGLKTHVLDVANEIAVHRGLVDISGPLAEKDREIESERENRQIALRRVHTLEEELEKAQARIQTLKRDGDGPYVVVTDEGLDEESALASLNGSPENGGHEPVVTGRTIAPKPPSKRHHTPPQLMRAVSDSEPPGSSEEDVQYVRLEKYLDFAFPGGIHETTMRVNHARHLVLLHRLGRFTKQVRIHCESYPARTPLELNSVLDLLDYTVRDGVLRQIIDGGKREIGVCGFDDPRDMTPRVQLSVVKS